jgi:deoxyadenosine/deoxycytidine kinase
MGNLAERDYMAYRHLFDLVMGGLPSPNLLVYLKCPVTVLMARIRRRARNMETGISTEYLALLDSFYEEWLKAYDLSPVLTIRTDDLDYVNQPQALEVVVERIQERLGGKEELDLRSAEA